MNFNPFNNTPHDLHQLVYECIDDLNTNVNKIDLQKLTQLLELIISILNKTNGNYTYILFLLDKITDVIQDKNVLQLCDTIRSKLYKLEVIHNNKIESDCVLFSYHSQKAGYKNFFIW